MDAGYHAITAEKYHADPATAPSLSSSIAKTLLRESAYKAWYSHPRLNPDYRESHDDKFDLGTCAHAVLLEGDHSRIVIVEAADWRTKDAKEQREAARASGRTALLARHYEAVLKMVGVAKEFIGNSEVAEYWADADSELMGLWKEGDIWLRCLFDRIAKNRSVIMDYKSTGDSSPEVFGRQIHRMGYHIQDAFYRRGARALGTERPEFVFLAQSDEPPHECSLHGCDPALREIADGEVERAIQTWRQCIKTRKWPSYDGRIHWTLPTSWQIKDYELRALETA